MIILPTIEELRKEQKAVREKLKIATIKPKTEQKRRIEARESSVEPVVCLSGQDLARARYMLGVSDYLVWIFAVFLIIAVLVFGYFFVFQIPFIL